MLNAKCKVQIKAFKIYICLAIAMAVPIYGHAVNLIDTRASEAELQKDIKASLQLIHENSKTYAAKSGPHSGNQIFLQYTFEQLTEIHKVGVKTWSGFYWAFGLLDLDLEQYGGPQDSRAELSQHAPTEQEIYELIASVLRDASVPNSSQALYDYAFQLHSEAAAMIRVRPRVATKEAFMRKLFAFGEMLKRADKNDLRHLEDARTEIDSALHDLVKAEATGMTGTQDEQHMLRTSLARVESIKREFSVNTCKALFE